MLLLRLTLLNLSQTFVIIMLELHILTYICLVIKRNPIAPATPWVLLSSTKQRQTEYYKWQLTIPFLDRITRNLRDRFGKDQHLLILMNVANIIPSPMLTTLYWRTHVRSFVELYTDNLPCAGRLEEELEFVWPSKTFNGKQSYSKSDMDPSNP